MLANETLPILFQNDELLVVNKPAGIAVHPGPRTPHSVEALLPALAEAIGQRRLPTLMHRLDRDTSGCLILARKYSAMRRIAKLFETRGILKTYWAIMDELPATDEGMVDAPLAKVSSAEAGWRMVVDPAGKSAFTEWKVLDRAARLIEFRPRTGRTHQLRVHANCLGSAITGDPVYGPTKNPAISMRLHARQLDIPMLDGSVLQVIAPLPEGWPAPAENII